MTTSNHDFSFYNGKKVFITGHTGFKGSWICHALLYLGADILGYALKPPTNPSLFKLSSLDKSIKTIYGDIRDLDKLQIAINDFKPEIVIHMAAQPLVRESYKDPVTTYHTNVLGTVNICEAIRHCDSVKSFVNVTTDKVYLNKEWYWGYRENDELNGYDPYSNSKSCSELVTSSYKNSFFNDKQIAVSTCRAGNVIGGGDFATDRIIPDCVRAIQNHEDIIVRNPYSVRPYQHVLEPIFAYLLIAMRQYNDISLTDCYNIGPNDEDCVSTGDLVSLFCEKWNCYSNTTNLSWISELDGGPHEANFLKLDCSKIKNKLLWLPKWNINTALDNTIIIFDKIIKTRNAITDNIQKQVQLYLSN